MFTLSDGGAAVNGAKDASRRRFLAMGVAGAAVAGSVAGFNLLKLPNGSYITTKSYSASSTPADPTFDSNGVQLPSLTTDPPHRMGSIYFRSDLLQMRLDDGTSYYTIPKQQVFSKGGTILNPVPETVVIWRAPFSCTVTAVSGYQDTGAGSVVTACDGSTDLLSTDITIASPATWQEGGNLAMTEVLLGDSIAIRVVSVSGSPNYLGVQVELTQP